MTSLPDTPNGPDLDALREEIADLKNTPTEELVDPAPSEFAAEATPRPNPTDAIGSEDWDDPLPDPPVEN
jgi:hypothetical protein